MAGVVAVLPLDVGQVTGQVVQPCGQGPSDVEQDVGT